MTEDLTRRERWAAADAARNEARWGISYTSDTRTQTPEQLAHAAYAAGHRWFQLDVPVAYVQGTASGYDSQTRTHRPAEPVDAIGAVEAQGWRLEHVSTAFVPRGERSMGHVGGEVATASHGELVALYVFRRAEG